MPPQLLPASAQPFAPRAPPTIVLHSRIEPWLTQTLKRTSRIKRPLNSVPQHHRCLLDALSPPDAIWSLTSLMVPRAPAASLTPSSNPLIAALHHHQILHIDAYVVHIDMVSQHEVSFKLTPAAIALLTAHHADVFTPDTAAATPAWPDKPAHLARLRADFVSAVNRFVFRTGVRALEGLEDDGAGELLDGRAATAKAALEKLFVPLEPPPPPPPPQPLASSPLDSLSLPLPPPVDFWKVLPSTPSPTGTARSDPHPLLWTHLSAAQLPSPTPSFSPPAVYASTPMDYASTPMDLLPEPAWPLDMSLPALPALQCGSGSDDVMGGMGMGWPGFGAGMLGFGAGFGGAGGAGADWGGAGFGFGPGFGLGNAAMAM